MASWYGSEFHGHRTANGEIFDMRSVSAAHRTMPLPSYARVTNLANGHSIVVRVNDRGPFIGGRILDVSARVAKLLEFTRGVTKVRVDYIGKAPPAGSDGPTLLASLQTGAALASKGRPDLPPLLATLRSGGYPDAEPALTSESARPSAPDGGVTVAARVEPPAAAEPRSPFGDLMTSPFLTQVAGP